MVELDSPIIIDFPLRGGWVAAHTPLRKIPSHGTNALGQRYAFDFLRTDSRNGMHFFRDSILEYWLVGIPTKNCYCWQEFVYAPFDGEVILARDGLRERIRLHPVLDALVVVKNTISANAKAILFGARKVDLHLYLGNYVILKSKGAYALFAHLHPDSIAVEMGQSVREGDLLGKVGHTGNSTAPHLHFQLMDSADLLIAKGLPCAFKAYEVYHRGDESRLRMVYRVSRRGSDMKSNARQMEME